MDLTDNSSGTIMVSTISKIGRKGVVVIPKKLREALGLREGSLILMEVRGGELVLRPYAPKRVKLAGRVSQILKNLKMEELNLEP